MLTADLGLIIMLQTQIDPYAYNPDPYVGWGSMGYGYPAENGFTMYPDYGRPQTIYLGDDQKQQQQQNPMQMYDMYQQFAGGGGSAGSTVIGGGGSIETGAAMNYPWDAAGTSGGGMFDGLFGGSGGSAGGSSGGGMGGAAVAGYIIAAILGQEAATRSTSTTYEGVETGNAFRGQFGTEPWFAWLSDKWGMPVTAGEKFDAAVKNADQQEALQRLPAVIDYWANPIDNWIAAPFRKQWGDLGGWMFDPGGMLMEGFD